MKILGTILSVIALWFTSWSLAERVKPARQKPPVPIQNAALTLGALTTDRIVVTDSATIQNLDPFTACMWVYPTTLTDARKFFQKNTAGSTLRDFALSGTGGNVRIRIGKATTNTTYITNDTPFATTSKWYWTCMTFNSSAGAGQVVNLYVGDLTTLATERTYGTATDGTGAVQADSGNDLIIGSNPAFTTPLQGRFASFALYAAELTLEQVQQLQYQPGLVLSSTRMLHLYRNGAVNHTDLSGNGNTGVVTGVTASDDVPLPVLAFWRIR